MRLADQGKPGSMADHGDLYVVFKVKQSDILIVMVQKSITRCL